VVKSPFSYGFVVVSDFETDSVEMVTMVTIIPAKLKAIENGDTRREKLSLASQRSYGPYGSVSKPCSPGEHQNSW